MKACLFLLMAFCCGSAQAAEHEGVAAYEVAQQYRHGTRGLSRDPSQAGLWMAAAAQKGLPKAMFQYSNMLWSGEGVRQDAAQSRRWLEAAAEAELPEALQELALALRDGMRGFAPDPQRAAVLLVELEHAMRHSR